MATRYWWMTPADEPEEFTAGVYGFPTGLTSAAEELTVGQSSLVVWDPDGTWAFKEWRRFWIEDDAAPADHTVIFMGFLSRVLEESGFPWTGVARKWTLSFVDLNHVADKRVFRLDANRPAETDLERLAWLMGTNYISLANTNLTYQATSGGSALSARDYKHQRVVAMVQEMMEQSGRNAFVLYDEAEGPPTFVTPTTELALWYQKTNVSEYASDIRLTNDLSEIDLDWRDPVSTTFPFLDTTRQDRNPENVYARLIGAYDGGDAFVEDTAIADEYANRDGVISMPNVTSATVAQVRLERIQEEGSQPQRIVETGYICGPAHVNALMQGQRFEFKASYLSELTDWTWLRCLKRTVSKLGPMVYQVEVTGVPIDIATPPAPTSCSAIANAIEIQDSGKQAGSSPEGAEIPAAGANPRIVFSTVCFANNGTKVGNSLTEAGAMTLLDTLSTVSGYDHTMAGIAYSTTTSAITPVWTWSNGFGRPNRWRQVSFEIPTAATAPVQSGSTQAQIITLGAPPTPGNLLVLVRILQPPSSSGSWDDPPPGFTLKGLYDVSDTGLEGQNIEVWTRCVEAGDDEEYDCSTSSYYHKSFLSEWELT